MIIKIDLLLVHLFLAHAVDLFFILSQKFSYVSCSDVHFMAPDQCSVLTNSAHGHFHFSCVLCGNCLSSVIITVVKLELKVSCACVTV